MLVQCVECEREISDDAKFCPHCGKPKSRKPINLPAFNFLALSESESLSASTLCTSILIPGKKPGSQRTVNSIGFMLYHGPTLYRDDKFSVDLRFHACCILFLPVIPFGIFLCRNEDSKIYSLGKVPFFKFLGQAESGVILKFAAIIAIQSFSLIIAIVAVFSVFAWMID